MGTDSIKSSALRAVRYGADALVVVGKEGRPPDIRDIRSIKKAVSVPVGNGSGVNPETIKEYISEADFFLVSGYTKFGGVKSNPVDKERVARLVETKRKLPRR